MTLFESVNSQLNQIPLQRYAKSAIKALGAFILHRSISQAGGLYNIEPTLIAAIIMQESGGNVAAKRFERAFWEKHLADTPRAKLIGKHPGIGELPSLETERIDRATSFGHMQVLGETARENGYDAQYLSDLGSDIASNVLLGSAYLARCIERKGGIVRLGVLLYNGGGDVEYPDKVQRQIISGAVRCVYPSARLDYRF